MTNASSLIDHLSRQYDVMDFLSTLDYRAASTRQELESAYNLVYKEYLKRGYTRENNVNLRLSIFNALPQTTTFIAVSSDTIFATATLIPDSQLGLPMDEIYSSELNQFRQENKKICEISMLASNTDLFDRGVSMMMNARKMFFIFYLFKLIFDYARQVMRLDRLCISINPKHSLTYDFLLFKDLGSLKLYNHANGAPAVAKYLDLNEAEEECKKEGNEALLKMFFLNNTPPEKFAHKITLRPQDLKYFFVDKTCIFKNISPFALEYVKDCYPSYDFSEIIS